MEGILTLSNALIAIATLALVLVTSWYVHLTNKLVRLQIEPSVECGIDHTKDGKNILVLQNVGTEKVINVSVTNRHFIFRDLRQPPIMSALKAKRVPGKEDSPWWKIPRLNPGEIQSRDAGDFLGLVKHNHNAMRRTRAAQEKTDPSKIELYSLVFFDVAYQRKVDRKWYWTSEAYYFRESGGDEDIFLWPAEVLRRMSGFAEAIEAGRKS